MSARALDGRSLAAEIREGLAMRVAALAADGDDAPRLTILRSGASDAAAMYAGSLERAAGGIGLPAEIVHRPAGELAGLIPELNDDERVAGIVVAQPLDDPVQAQRVVELVDPDKDVDGATPTNAGRLLRGEPAFVPATALAVIALIEAYGIGVAGRRAVVIGRSAVVGRPVASLLLARDATVVVCHRATRDLAAETRRAEILVAAAGVAGVVTPDMVDGDAVVIDCGINASNGRIVGDVDPLVADRVAAMTPVPGGVGPVTPVMVLRQTVEAAERMRGRAGA